MTREQAYKTLQNKKIYVGNKNKEIQDKLLEYGFKRTFLESYYLDKSVNFLYIYNKDFKYGSDLDIFFNDPLEQISMETLFDIEIEDSLKIGDICIFWDESKKEAIISKLCEIDDNENPYMSNNGLWHQNAIKFMSIEHYIKFIE